MAKFKLTPNSEHLTDPSWRYSSEKRVIYVGASDEIAARHIAAGKYGQFAKVEPGTPTPVGIPWLSPDLTSCIEIAELGVDRMPYGYVYAAD